MGNCWHLDIGRESFVSTHRMMDNYCTNYERNQYEINEERCDLKSLFGFSSIVMRIPVWKFGFLAVTLLSKFVSLVHSTHVTFVPIKIDLSISCA